MASSTRSGRVLRHEGTSRRGGGNATSKGTNIRDSPTSSSKATGTKNREGNGTANDTRSSTASGFVTPDSYSLKNSSSEVTDKKMTASTPTSRKSERVEKKRSRSPLRRSERIEKNAISSSPGSKKLKESLNSPLKKKKKSDDKNGKIPVASTENQSKNNKLDTENSGISKKKTRLDARRYRALLQPKNDEFSGKSFAICITFSDALFINEFQSSSVGYCFPSYFMHIAHLIFILIEKQRVYSCSLFYFILLMTMIWTSQMTVL